VAIGLIYQMQVTSVNAVGRSSPSPRRGGCQDPAGAVTEGSDARRRVLLRRGRGVARRPSRVPGA